MLIKELPKKVSDKTFSNIKEFVVFIHQEQLLTEYWELSKKEVTKEMLEKLNKAKALKEDEFVNI